MGIEYIPRKVVRLSYKYVKCLEEYLSIVSECYVSAAVESLSVTLTFG